MGYLDFGTAYSPLLLSTNEELAKELTSLIDQAQRAHSHPSSKIARVPLEIVAAAAAFEAMHHFESSSGTRGRVSPITKLRTCLRDCAIEEINWLFDNRNSAATTLERDTAKSQACGQVQHLYDVQYDKLDGHDL